jgi:hypothetical protein
MSGTEVVPFKPAKALVADNTQTVVKLANVLAEMGLSGEQVQAEDLIGTTFVIRRAKPFQSSFNKDDHAYFCVIAVADTGELKTVVLGGMAVVEILDAYIDAGAKAPLEVTLRQTEGGSYGHYYTLE